MSLLDLQGKNVLVVGLGNKGISAVKLLHQKGAIIRGFDVRSRGELGKAMSELATIPMESEFGRPTEKSFNNLYLVVLCAPVDAGHPFLEPARAAGALIIPEVELAYRFKPKDVQVVAVTGSVGKTTVGALLQGVLKKEGHGAFFAGNTGYPLSDAPLAVGDNKYWIVELTAPQIRGLKEFKADMWIGMSHPADELIEKLANIRSTQTVCVVNWGDEQLRNYSKAMLGKVFAFINKDIAKDFPEWMPTFNGVYAVKRRLVHFRSEGKDIPFNLEQFKMPGPHNRENAMATIAAGLALGIDPKAWDSFFEEFKGVPHRLEFVRRKDGVIFFNDSEATNVTRVARALNSFDQQIILVMGGKDVDDDYESLVSGIKKKVKNLILVGQAKEKINRILGDYSETFLVGTFEEAVLISYQKSRSGDIVLLAPGCPPNDMFKSVEERGEYYRKLVHQL